MKEFRVFGTKEYKAKIYGTEYKSLYVPKYLDETKYLVNNECKVFLLNENGELSPAKDVVIEWKSPYLDKKEQAIYQGDIVSFQNDFYICLYEICFGEYLEDETDGEYEPKKRYGWYGKLLDNINLTSITKEYEDDEYAVCTNVSLPLLIEPYEEECLKNKFTKCEVVTNIHKRKL